MCVLVSRLLLSLCVVVSTQLLYSKASQALTQGDEDAGASHQGAGKAWKQRGGDARWKHRDNWRVSDYQRRYGSGYGSGMQDDDEDHRWYSGSGSGSGPYINEGRNLQGGNHPYLTVTQEDDLYMDNDHTPENDLLHSGSAQITVSLATVTLVTIATSLLWLNG